MAEPVQPTKGRGRGKGGRGRGKKVQQARDEPVHPEAASQAVSEVAEPAVQPTKGGGRGKGGRGRGGKKVPQTQQDPVNPEDESPQEPKIPEEPQKLSPVKKKVRKDKIATTDAPDQHEQPSGNRRRPRLSKGNQQEAAGASDQEKKKMRNSKDDQGREINPKP